MVMALTDPTTIGAPMDQDNQDTFGENNVRTAYAAITRRGFMGLALAAASFSLAACGASSSASGEGSASTTSSSSDTSSNSSTSSDATDTSDQPTGPYASGVHHATIEVTDYGTISVALNANVAPITVSNFADLVEQGFYNGLTFHRVVKDFMIQGGDPNGDGTGGSGTTIKGEFSANGVKNDIAHVRGTISMARSSDYNSASSQFFIVQKTAASLNGQYAAFGNVTDGMDVVDAIVNATADKGDSNGILSKEDQPVIASITMVD